MRFIFSPNLEEPILFFKFIDHCHPKYKEEEEKCIFCTADAYVSLHNFQYPFKYESTLGKAGLGICRKCESTYRCYRPDIEEIEIMAMKFEKKRQTKVKNNIKTLVISNICDIINDYREDTELL